MEIYLFCRQCHYIVTISFCLFIRPTIYEWGWPTLCSADYHRSSFCFAESTRQRAYGLVAQAYTSIAVEDFAAFVGYSVEEAVKGERRRRAPRPRVRRMMHLGSCENFFFFLSRLKVWWARAGRRTPPPGWWCLKSQVGGALFKPNFHCFIFSPMPEVWR